MAEVESIHSPASPQSPQSETIHSREPSSDLPLDDSQTKAMNGSSHEQTASSNTLVDPIDSGVDASVEGANAQDVFSSDPTKAPAKPKAAISGDAKIRKSMAPSSGKPTAKVSTGAAGATSPNVKKVIRCYPCGSRLLNAHSWRSDY